jgi:phosphoribosyl 1,2-cyclic phosphodiesterase
VKKLFLTHHEPTRRDDELEAVFQSAISAAGKLDFEVCLAQEGIEHRLS